MFGDNILALNPESGDLILYGDVISIYLGKRGRSLDGHVLFSTRTLAIFFAYGAVEANMLKRFDECLI